MKISETMLRRIIRQELIREFMNNDTSSVDDTDIDMIEDEEEYESPTGMKATLDRQLGRNTVPDLRGESRVRVPKFNK